MNNGETVAIGWIDNGLVHGSFMASVIEILMQSQNTENPITEVIRCPGLGRGNNRDRVIESWEKTESDWLLWIDSDMSPTFNHFKMLKEKANKDTSPLVSGLYFGVNFFPNQELPITTPVAGSEKPIDLDVDHLQPISWAGLGFTLLHRNVIKLIKNKFGNDVKIHQQEIADNTTSNDDIPFFSKAFESGIQPLIYAKVIIPHIKSIPVGLEYHLGISK